MEYLKVKFITNPSRINKKGLTPLELQLTFDKKRISIRTGKFINPKKWNCERQKVSGDNDINDFMDALRSKVFGIETNFLKLDIDYNLDMIKDKLNESSNTHTILSLLNMFDNILCERVSDKVITESTYLKYRQNDKHFRSFLRDKIYSNVDYINGNLINSYYEYLLKSCSINSAISIVNKLKVVCEYGKSIGWIKNDPFFFINFKKEKKETIKYLTEEQLNKICNLNILDKEMGEIRDIFLFCCFTSLSYIDCKQFEKRHICLGLKGNFIVKNRQKTGTEQKIPLMEVAENILKKYDYHLPVPSIQKYNLKLKELADLTGIDFLLHSHVARHTCATLLLNHNISIEGVSKILGHSTTTMSYHYAKMLDETIYDQVLNNFNINFNVV